MRCALSVRAENSVDLCAGCGAFAPLHVCNADRFIRSIEALGYTLADRWDVHERALHVPGHPERSFPRFTGLYFAR